jgi:iron complex outermembrane receptor protein
VWGVRGHLQFLISDSVEFLLSANYLEENSSRSLAPSPNPDLPSPAVQFFGGMITGDEDSVLFDVPSFAEVEAWGVSGKLTWDLGPVTLTSLTSYGETQFFEELDIDATSADFLFNKPYEDSEYFTEELTITSNTEGQFDWVAGFFYLREDAGQFWNIGGGLFDATVFPGFSVNPAGVVEVEAWAVFGQGTYKISDQWHLTVGARYSEEQKDHVFIDAFATTAGAVRAGAPCGPPFCAEFPEDDRWTAWTPKVGVEFFPTDDLMAYFAVSRGFKSGGFNSSGRDKFDPEFLWNYEFGLKATWLDDRVRTNLSAFYYDYEDIQVQVAVPGTGGAVNALENAASADVYGFEAEILARPAPGWDLAFALAWLNAEYSDYCTIDPDNPAVFDASCGLDGLGLAFNQDLSGNVLPRAPELSATGSVQYAWSAGSAGEVFTRVEWRYQSEIFFNQYEVDGVNQDGYHLFNARVQFDSANDRWYVALWGKNLADESSKQSVIRNTALIGSLDFFGPRRTYGLQVGFRY